MISLDTIVSEFSPSIITKIEESEKDGKCFLECFNQFSESDLVDIVSSSSLFDYMKDILMNSTEDSSVVCILFVFIIGVAIGFIGYFFLFKLQEKRYKVFCYYSDTVCLVFILEVRTDRQLTSMFLYSLCIIE